MDLSKLVKEMDIINQKLYKELEYPPHISFVCPCGNEVYAGASECKFCGTHFSWRPTVSVDDVDLDGDSCITVSADDVMDFLKNLGRTPVEKKEKKLYIPHPVKVWYATHDNYPTCTVQYDNGSKQTTVCDLLDVGYFDKFTEFCYNVARYLSLMLPDHMTSPCLVKEKGLKRTFAFADERHISVTAPDEDHNNFLRSAYIAACKKMFGSTSHLMKLYNDCITNANEKSRIRKMLAGHAKAFARKYKEEKKKAFEALVENKMYDIRVEREARRRLRSQKKHT